MDNQRLALESTTTALMIGMSTPSPQIGLLCLNTDDRQSQIGQMHRAEHELHWMVHAAHMTICRVASVPSVHARHDAHVLW